VNGVEYACKMTGFALPAADLALRAIASRSRRTPWAGKQEHERGHYCYAARF
jgi:hypothetical protein